MGDFAMRSVARPASAELEAAVNSDAVRSRFSRRGALNRTRIRLHTRRNQSRESPRMQKQRTCTLKSEQRAASGTEKVRTECNCETDLIADANERKVNAKKEGAGARERKGGRFGINRILANAFRLVY